MYVHMKQHIYKHCATMSHKTDKACSFDEWGRVTIVGHIWVTKMGHNLYIYNLLVLIDL